jgi:hypothetical protein
VDFRKLNEITENEAYGLPNLIEILESLGSSKYFSTLDLASGYHQIRIDEKDRHHHDKLSHVFDRLRIHNLKLQPEKCAFLRKEVLYLRHVINEHGVTLDPNKIKCIENYPRPQNSRDIKSFLGLLNYYRRFVDNFAKIAKPLTALLKKDVIFKRSDKCEEAFSELKRVLTSPPLLVYPDWEKGNFNLMTDASQFAIGAVLSQGEVPRDKSIAYASRTLNQAEVNYSVIQKELLAIVWAVKYFRPYLYGRKFNIITDHRPLTYLFSVKDVSSQLMRWRLQLAEYDYIITYRAGLEHANADCLSRIHTIQDVINEEESFEEFLIAEKTPIFNSKIMEHNGSIRNADPEENLLIPIPGDGIITHPAVREIIERNEIKNIQFKGGDQVCLLQQEARMIILFNYKDTHVSELTAQQIFDTFNGIKVTCRKYNINNCSTIRVEGSNSLTSYERTRTMIRYIFKGTNINVKIYTKQNFTPEKHRLIYEYHDALLGGHSGVSRIIKRLKLNYN